MKPLQFTIPLASQKAIIVQEDELPDFYPYLHRHKEAQLVWIIKGEGTLLVDYNTHLFKSGSIFYIAPQQTHLFKSSQPLLNNGKNIHTLSVFFDPLGGIAPLSLLPELKGLSFFLNAAAAGLYIDLADTVKIADCMKQVKLKKNYEQVAAFLILLKVLSGCLNNSRPLTLLQHTATISEGEGLRMRTIYDYINKNYTGNIALNDIAAAVHLTPQAFCRFLKKHSGTTFVTILNQMRIHEVCKILSQGNYESVSTAAYSVGFNNVTHFNRVFKNITGISPLTFVNNIKKY